MNSNIQPKTASYSGGLSFVEPPRYSKPMNDLGGLYVSVHSDQGSVSKSALLDFVRDAVVGAGYDPDGHARSGFPVAHGVVAHRYHLWFYDKLTAVAVVPKLTDNARFLASLVVEQAGNHEVEVEGDTIRDTIDQLCKLHDISVTEAERIAACQEAKRLWAARSGDHVTAPKRDVSRIEQSGRFIVDDAGRKIAEMYPGTSPDAKQAIKRRLVQSFNALPDLVGVLLRADKEGGLWQALYNEGITDSYDAALAASLNALGDDGIADVAARYELDPERIRAKLGE
ncbi:hypothetical protein [Paraburkholderia fungorum]|uniref:hypothetical protein n=1 Tax=Paraburkholderia fungorum TaxID=134537 RepID=UPI00161B4324|nr:hypothetical protein [Paraburkholderia fungorum]MBB5546585.1 hypothetical protein [Paraburkholderia fungorum]